MTWIIHESIGSDGSQVLVSLLGFLEEFLMVSLGASWNTDLKRSKVANFLFSDTGHKCLQQEKLMFFCGHKNSGFVKDYQRYM